MKTNLTDEELIKIGYEFNIFKTYLFKVVDDFNAMFVNADTREIDCQCDEKYIEELKIEVE